MSTQKSIQDGLEPRDIEAGFNTDGPKPEYNTVDIENGERSDANQTTPSSDQNGTKDTNVPEMSGFPFHLLMSSVTFAVLLIAFNATALGTVRENGGTPIVYFYSRFF